MALPPPRGTPRIPRSMKIFHWVRYSWSADSLGEPIPGKLPVNCVVRAAERRDLDAVQSVIENSFTLDTDWAESYKRFRAELAEQIEQAFEQTDAGCLVLAHGARIVGVSVYSLDPAAENHLISGPCILLEYRNRGLGSDTLWRTLQALRQAGLKTMFGLTRKTVPASKFVYPKFGGVGEPYDLPVGSGVP
jgi:predicted N-acetyltransferase YhbS